MKEMTISLKGLTCANCAGKIEKAVGEMPETKEAEINLLDQFLHIIIVKTGIHIRIFKPIGRKSGKQHSRCCLISGIIDLFPFTHHQIGGQLHSLLIHLA